MVLSAAEIADLKALQESTMIDTCTISDPSHKVGQQGQVWTPRASSVICGVSSLSQAISTGQVTIDPGLGPNETAFVFALPVSVAPIKQGARIGWNSGTYEVRSVDLPGSYAMQVQVIAVLR